ncbi:uncharacterized protein N7511_010166 [Penicillium nucicola]|uniref:uncharacterized protein n=1 Tax=Penicillium nucicola TaxID=1850975 RepID=UPI002545B8CF|nr:uncharacterized protein N7511_010166 [Penicillium nucicola]KAJ5748470.1 hypothetical protein N7511_010166 [Penicillium nucicola]
MSSSTSTQNNLSVDNVAGLAPILTDGTVKRLPTNAKDRLSTYSNVSFASQNRSRPGSHVFPIFHTSLPYALVRDFAYPSIHPLHYGPPPPRASGVSTPASEYRRLSDPPTSWDTSRGPWSTAQWGNEATNHGHQQLPAMSFGDGPPYSEDEDLHSPVVTSRHRKRLTDMNGLVDERVMSGIGQSAGNNDRGTLVGINADGSETYYVNDGDSSDDGPGGEYITYPPNEGRYSMMGYSAPSGQQSYEHDPGFESEDEIPGGDRYSNDYQFAVGCPDEEMHGKAVALFDFTREHENELPLTEGQVIYVSYRHGQGWLVAEDPKTGENGLVPEEFVRLLRDIEGGLTSLNGEGLEVTGSSADTNESDQLSTPTQTERPSLGGNTCQSEPQNTNGNTLVTSTESASSEPASAETVSDAGKRNSKSTKT